MNKVYLQTIYGWGEMVKELKPHGYRVRLFRPHPAFLNKEKTEVSIFKEEVIASVKFNKST